ncbi:hypothetical protein U9M48_039395 [Paspalum notatum var. saurae]|uniref:Uncharacterized protein n=1 Tax=Paspalum notatum var. saurae TaxID=547442 RepID=A0AAQ3XCN6_PASNO
MAQRRAAGLSYNCDEKFTYGHKRKKLFILEIVSDNNPVEPEHEQEQSEEEPLISLHALTGIRATTYHTMCIWVLIGNRRLTAFLDSGFSHNFINSEVAEDL